MREAALLCGLQLAAAVAFPTSALPLLAAAVGAFTGLAALVLTLCAADAAVARRGRALQ